MGPSPDIPFMAENFIAIAFPRRSWQPFLDSPPLNLGQGTPHPCHSWNMNDFSFFCSSPAKPSRLIFVPHQNLSQLKNSLLLKRSKLLLFLRLFVSQQTFLPFSKYKFKIETKTVSKLSVSSLIPEKTLRRIIPIILPGSIPACASVCSVSGSESTNGSPELDSAHISRCVFNLRFSSSFLNWSFAHWVDFSVDHQPVDNFLY